jgi:RNA polymerase sigma-70 factor (ECF subfamily)
MPDTTPTTSGPGRGLLAILRACRVSLGRVLAYIPKRRNVDDLLQEAFISSYESAGKSSIRNPPAFLLRAATHLTRNHTSRVGLRQAANLEDVALADVFQLTTESPQAQLDSNRRFVVLCRAVGGLPEECRRVFILKKVYGLSQQEIAERLSIAPAAVEKHISQGLLMCREYMESVGCPQPGSEGGPNTGKSGQRQRS